MYIIRPEESTDHKSIREMHLKAFGESSPGALVDDLRNASATEISIVCESSGKIVGHVLFSRLQAPFRALTMAPVGVCPTSQKNGIGSRMIRQGLQIAKREGWQIVFVLGDPNYYERFGFSATTAQNYDSPYNGTANMAIILDEIIPNEGAIKFPAAFDQDIAQHQARR